MGCSGASPAARFYGRNPAHGRGQLMAGFSELADLLAAAVRAAPDLDRSVPSYPPGRAAEARGTAASESTAIRPSGARVWQFASGGPAASVWCYQTVMLTPARLCEDGVYRLFQCGGLRRRARGLLLGGQ